MRALNRFYRRLHKKKKHPASKCHNAKCGICSIYKLNNIPKRRELRENSKKHLLEGMERTIYLMNSNIKYDI